MLKVIIWGAGGRMGQVLSRLCLNDEEIELVCGIDCFASQDDFNYTIFSDYRKCDAVADVLIDFSRPEAIGDIAEFCSSRKMPAVLATTGYDSAQLAKIESLSSKIAVFRSYNMSLGINLLSSLVRTAAEKIGADFDVEIIEKHHNQKADAPSGTALMLADAVGEGLSSKRDLVFGRHGKSAKRVKNEVGIHAVRGGTIVGEHDVVFAGYNEIITLSHSAQSKEIFASGAVTAAKFIKDKPCGMYSMKDIFG